jgi:hypothetical protein
VNGRLLCAMSLSLLAVGVLLWHVEDTAERLARDNVLLAQGLDANADAIDRYRRACSRESLRLDGDRLVSTRRRPARDTLVVLRGGTLDTTAWFDMAGRPIHP